MARQVVRTLRSAALLDRHATWLIPAALAAGVALALFPRWGHALPCGDEAYDLRLAMEHLRAGQWTANLYRLAHMGTLRVLGEDPVAAHYAMRLVTAVGTTVLLYLFLLRLSGTTSRWAAVLCALWWARSYLVMPMIQFGNANMFCFLLLLPGLCLVARRFSPCRYLFLAFSFLAVSLVRVEFLGPFVVWVALGPVIWLALGRPGLPVGRNPRLLAGVLLAVTVSLGSLQLVRRISGPGLNEHLLLGLNQCYVFLLKQGNPDLVINPMQEYSLVTDRVFGGAKTFTQACRYNPGEVLRYLAFNSLNNAVVFLPSMLEHRPLFPGLYTVSSRIPMSMAFLTGSLVGLWLAWRRRRNRSEAQTGIPGPTPDRGPLLLRGLRLGARGIRVLIHNGLAAPLALAVAAIVPFCLHIPDARYWIPCVPLLYALLAAGWSALLATFRRRRLVHGLCALCALILAQPYPLPGRPANGAAIRALRQRTGLPDTIAVAGSPPLAFYALGLRVRPVALETITPDAIRQGRIDVLVVDNSLRQSATWAAHAPFWLDFELETEKHGYQRVLAQPYGDGLYVYQRHSEHPQP